MATDVLTEAAQREGVTKLVAKDTSFFPDPTDKNDYDEATKPDVTIYPDTEEANGAFTICTSRQKKEGTANQEVEEQVRGRRRARELEARTAW